MDYSNHADLASSDTMHLLPFLSYQFLLITCTSESKSIDFFKNIKS